MKKLKYQIEGSELFESEVKEIMEDMRRQWELHVTLGRLARQIGVVGCPPRSAESCSENGLDASCSAREPVGDSSPRAPSTLKPWTKVLKSLLRPFEKLKGFARGGHRKSK
jgi:hypothetical protein